MGVLSGVVARAVPYLPLLKWGLIVAVPTVCFAAGWHYGQKSLLEEALEEQNELNRDSVRDNVERAEKAVGGLADKARRIEVLTEEFNRAIEEARAIDGNDSCVASDDELLLLNRLIGEANDSSVPKERTR